MQSSVQHCKGGTVITHLDAVTITVELVLVAQINRVMASLIAYTKQSVKQVEVIMDGQSSYTTDFFKPEYSTELEAMKISTALKGYSSCSMSM